MWTGSDSKQDLCGMKSIVNVFVVMAGLLFFLPTAVPAMPNVAIVTETTETTVYQKMVMDEITTLMAGRGGVAFIEKTVDPHDTDRSVALLSMLMADKSIDCVIGMGALVSDILIRMKQYPGPAIAAVVVDRKLQGLALTSEGTSGIKNFNYIQSNFDVEKDLRTFQSLYDYSHLAVLLPGVEAAMFHILYSYFGRTVKTVSPAAGFSFVEIDPGTITQDIPEIPSDVDAVYLLSFFSGQQGQPMEKIIRAVNHRKLPSFAMMGETHVRMGAMAAIAPDRNLDVMARRIAINVLDIFEGRDAGTLPVSASTYTENFVVNVETLQTIDYYPGWAALDSARLLNLDKLHQGVSLQLKGVILEALERNLDLLAAQTDIRIQEAEAGKAQGALLPQVHLSAGMTHIDENRVKATRNYPARTTLTASAGLSQAVFSDDLLANHAVQKILTASLAYQEEAVLLDTVVTAAQAYIDLLFAMSTQTIQSNNLEVTRKNLEIARKKAAVGAVDASEVSRWESEKAASQIRLNTAYRDLQLARMRLNQVMDRPITRKFSVSDIGLVTGVELMITDPDVYRLLANIKQARRFSDFLVVEADRNMPELKQVQENIRSQERQVLNRKRALFLPDVVLKGSVDKILDERDAWQTTPSDLDHPWSISLTASWPIFTGGADKKDLDQSRYRLQRLQIEQRNLRNQLHLNVRSSLETAAVAAREIALADTRLAAAMKSFEIVQAGYAEGRNSLTDLIDAQDARVSSERAAALAKYQFVLDFLEMERAVGRFYFLESPEEKQAFLHRLNMFMAANPEQ
jgi:outer membrane protein